MPIGRPLVPVLTLAGSATAALRMNVSDFEVQLVALRDYLMRFARLQLRNETWAEDVVSETLLAALAKPQAFQVLIGNSPDDDNADPLEHIAFKADGHFVERPADWGNPEQDLNSQQFMVVLDACTEKLPPVQGRLFLMREWLEMSSDDICKELGMTSTNLYVQLHRARLRLRECLELNWFARS